jgi:hypothetical protein
MLEVVVPLGRRLEGEQGSRRRADMERQRAAPAQREQIDARPVDALDADGVRQVP